MLCPYYPQFDHPNIWQKVKIIELLIMQFSTSSFWPTYSPQSFFLTHPIYTPKDSEPELYMLPASLLQF